MKLGDSEPSVSDIIIMAIIAQVAVWKGSWCQGQCGAALTRQGDAGQADCLRSVSPILGIDGNLGYLTPVDR